MDTQHLNALQRAALDGLARQFFDVGARSRHWSATPLPLQGRYGAWTATRDSGVMTLQLAFRDVELGNFHLLTKGTQLHNWAWYAHNPSDWYRTGGGSPSSEGGQKSPIPDDLFNRLWVDLHTGCQRYIAHFKLHPQGYARTIFSPR